MANDGAQRSAGSRDLAADFKRKTGGSRTRWNMFFMLLGIGTMSYIDRASISVAMPLISEELNLSPQQEGLILSAFFWTYGLFAIPGGWLADKIGPRRIISGMMVFWALFQAAVGFAKGVPFLVLMRLGLGATEAAQFPAGGKLNSLWLPENERTRGAVLMNSSAALGTAVGALLVGALISAFNDWREAFYGLGALTLLATVAVWWYMRDRPREHKGVSEEELAYLETEFAREDARDAEQITEKKPAIHFLRFRTFWAMGIGWMMSNVVFYGIMTFGPLYLSEARGFEISSVAGATSIMFGAGFVGENFAGWWASKWRKSGGSPNVVMKTILTISAAMATATVGLVAVVDSATLAVTLLTVTMFFVRFMGVYWSLPATLTDRSRSGVLGGMMNVFAQIGGLLIPLVTGFIVAATGSYVPALLLFAACGFVYLLANLTIDFSKKLPA